MHTPEGHGHVGGGAHDDGSTVTTHSGGRIRLTDVNLRVPYSLYCTLYDCSFDHLEQMLLHTPPAQIPNLRLSFLEPVSRLVAGSTISLFEYSFPRIGPVVVTTGVDAATTFFQTGNPDAQVTGTAEIRAQVWRELHFYANGEVQVNGSANGLELDHGQFTFGFRLELPH
jgi:hypothetical protein